MHYFKNYFLVFLLSYTILISTKFIFYFYLQSSFSELSFTLVIYSILWGYKFDFAMSAIVALLTSFFSLKQKCYAVVASSLLVALFLMQMGDILYFHDSSRHVGYEVRDIANDAYSLLMTALSQHTFLSLFSFLVGVGLFTLLLKLFSSLTTLKFTKFYILHQLFAIVLSVFFIRGMFQHIPLNPWEANQIGDAKQASLALNASYNVLYSLVNKKKNLEPLKIPSLGEKETRDALARVYAPSEEKERELPLLKTKPNVVFLFLESWSAVHLKPYGSQYETTPFYNSLLEKSIRPKLMIASGHRTTEGIFATLVSAQNPLGKSVAKTQLQTYNYNSIVDIFNAKGYSSAFFQGSSKETSGTGSFAQSLGFKGSYGKRDIKKRVYEENYWGVYDQDLYTFVQEKLETTLPEPFVIGINGATTHDNKIPQGHKSIFFSDDASENADLNALRFSDDALKEFVQNIEKKYPNTLFVLFADHCGGGITTSMQNYMIPFAIYSKKLIKAHYYDTIISQRDIAPTLYDIAIGDYKKEGEAFSGKSLLQDKSFFAEYYHNGVIGWIEGEEAIELNIVTNKIECYRVKDFHKEKREYQEKHQLLKEDALAFFNLSQSLLFSNKTMNFPKYREDYK